MKKFFSLMLVMSALFVSVASANFEGFIGKDFVDENFTFYGVKNSDALYYQKNSQENFLRDGSRQSFFKKVQTYSEPNEKIFDKKTFYREFRQS